MPLGNAVWTLARRLLSGTAGRRTTWSANEYTHGVTEYESNLNYTMQSGAINESFSDIWGEFIDLTNAKGGDSASVRWLIGKTAGRSGT